MHMLAIQTLSRARAAALIPVACLLISAVSAAQAQQSPGVPSHQEHGNLIFEGIPPLDTAMAARLERYQQSRQATFLDWQADGSMLVATRFGEVEQVHRIAAPLGMREQLTFSQDPVSVARAPAAGAGNGFVFLKDHGGDENAQIYYYAGSGNVRQLTTGNFLHSSPVWSHDGKRVAFSGNERDGQSYDVYLADVSNASAPRLLVGGQQDTWYPLDWSPDDKKLLLWKYVSAEESYLYIADVAAGSFTPVDESARKNSVNSAKFAPDGRGIYLVSVEDGDFAQLRYLDPVSHEERRITPDIPWDIENFDVSVDGRYIAYVVNEDGHSRLTVIDGLQKLELTPPGLPEGQISNIRFDHTGKRLAMSVDSAQAPRDVYVYDLAHSAIERWTKSEIGALDANTLASAELIRYPTWDRVAGKQRMISAYVYRPRGPAISPVVIDIHGGPESQFRPHWDPFVQFLVNELGYAVIAPNVRGSSGYGKSFLRLDNGVLREDAVRDIGSLLFWIGLQPAFDRDHVAVMGGSYGGYMALASLAAYSDRLRGGIDVSGISNFVTFLGSTSPYRRDLRREEYGDERDPKMRVFLNRISPLNNSLQIRRPLLVVQGLNDPRVPPSESQQMVYRIRAKGGEAWYLAAKDEGHGFRRKANQDVYLQTAAMFLNKLAH
jgi:dipeptidyl aminopeptidase/acylaminoacyl peptidase